MEIVVEVANVVVVAEKYAIESLPDSWADMSDFQRYDYLQDNGVNVADNKMYSSVENVNVNWEG